MPELPEVETVRRSLQKTVVGKQIKSVEVLYDKIITGDIAEFQKKISGETIEDVLRMGKFLIFSCKNTVFISHLRMEGKYNFYSLDHPIGKHEHLIFNFTDGTQLRYQDVRKFGRLQLMDKENYRLLPPLSDLGAEPWEADPNQVFTLIHRSRLPIKSLLLDQRIIAGIGNIYANEICFRAGINPYTSGKELKKEQVNKLVQVSAEILQHSISLGGTSIHSFSNQGESGHFQDHLEVHMQKTCHRCQGEIKKEKIGGRGTYFCPHCQRM